MIHWLLPGDKFPPPNRADEEGFLAAGGDLSVETLLRAYKKGIFPWYNHDEPILWWSPQPRCVLYPGEVKITKSMRNVLNQDKFSITLNQEFKTVMTQAGKVKRKGQEGTWIHQPMIDAYYNLHLQGWAHSVEVWQANELVGGVYGVSIGKIFYGESMFAKTSNASKVGLISLCRFLEHHDFHLIDCQVTTKHLQSMGAVEISREKFSKALSTYAHASEYNHPLPIWDHKKIKQYE